MKLRRLTARISDTHCLHKHCFKFICYSDKCVTSETKETFVSRTNALLVDTLIIISGDVSMSIT